MVIFSKLLILFLTYKLISLIHFDLKPTTLHRQNTESLHRQNYELIFPLQINLA